MQPVLSVALLGTGFMGKAHSNAYCQAAHFFDLPCRLRRRLLVGRNPETLAAMASRWEWEETAADWRAAISRDDIDAVDIALPNHLHAEVAMAAAEAGKIVLCEKPLARSLDEARRMADAARDVPTMVWFNYRRVPAVAYAHSLIAAGRIGPVFHYNASYKQQWGADPSRPPGWRMDPALAGSGAAGDLLTHAIDLALFLNGPIAETSAAALTFAPGRRVDDAVIALVRFANGSAGTFEATRFGVGCKNRNAFEIHGSGGLLRFDLERLNHLEWMDASAPSAEQGPRNLLVTNLEHPVFGHFWRPGHIIGYEHTFIAALAEFVQTLARRERFRPDFADGLAVQTVLDAMERSAGSRQWERPEPIDDRPL